MDSVVTTLDQTEQAESLLRQELALGDTALAGVAPVLSHLLATTGQALVSEDLVARMRGMLSNLANAILVAEAAAASSNNDPAANSGELASELASSSVLVSHCYAVAMESQLTEEIEQRCGVDQVLTPLLQELIASNDESVAELAMAAMSAQARFVQAQRRMSLPLTELPAELFHEAISCWRNTKGNTGDAQALDRVITLLRSGYDEGNSRLGLLTRLAGAMGNGLRATLDLEHAGFALFVTGLARASKQPRELAILSCHERQATRLALALRAAGLKPEEVRKQFLLIQSELALPEGADSVSQQVAADLLTGTHSGRAR